MRSMKHWHSLMKSHQQTASRRLIRAALETLERRTLLSTFTVNTFNDQIDSTGSSTVSLRDAIAAAAANPGADTIDVPAGTYILRATLGELQVSDASGNLTIQSAGGTAIINGGNHSARVLEIDAPSNVAITGVEVTGGNLSLSGNASIQQGAGIYNTGTLMLTNVQVENNTITSLSSSTALVENTTLSGGGIENTGNLTITDSTISNNTISDGSELGGNCSGGGIDNSGMATITDSTISGNSLETIGNSALKYDDTADENGGGIHNSGNLTLTDVIVDGNNIADQTGLHPLDTGAGIDNTGNLAVTDSTIANDSVVVQGGGEQGVSGGGGIANTNSGIATIVDSTISGDSAQTAGLPLAYGGGIFNNGGYMTLSDSTISGDSANASPFGGALSTPRDASMDAAGGGILADNGNLTVKDSTISDNSVTAPVQKFVYSNNTYYLGFAYGGGIGNRGDTDLTIANSIISGNTVSASSTNYPGHVGNASGPDARTFYSYGTFNSLGNNLVGKTDGSSGWIASDLTGTIASPLNADLGPLANNGGPTQTMLPLPGSPAIGAGNNSLIPAGITTDQRGMPRSINGSVDIGAVEAQPVTTAFSNLSTSSSIPKGSASVAFSGTINAGTYIPPNTETVAITLNGVSQNAAINSSGNFSTLFTTSSLAASNTPYQVTYAYAGDASFNSVTDDTTTTLLVMPTNGTETSVWRLYSPVTKEHLYTADLNEYNTLGTRGWDQEGLAYEDYTGLVTIGGVTAEPLYRLYNIPEQQHLWTTDPNEYNTLKNFVGTWSVDGISGYIFPANGNTSTSLAAVPGSAALYRMSWPFNPSADLHLWTTDLNEYDTDAVTYGWTKEGVIGYVM